MNYENELEIDLGRCFRALMKKWWFMAVMAVLFGIAGLALTLEKEDDIYSATSSVYVMSAESYSQTQVGITAMNAYADIATSMKVCERAALLMGAENVTGEKIMKATTVSTGEESVASAYIQKNSTVMTVTCQSNNPVEAMEMAQAVAEAFVMEMENITGSDFMKYNFSKEIISKGTEVCSITADGFKSACVSVNFVLPLSEKASLFALVPNVLMRSSEKYTDVTEIEKKLALLYGAELVADVSKSPHKPHKSLQAPRECPYRSLCHHPAQGSDLPPE